ncbi:MAG TPA: ATP-binding protein [Chroococcales cyanobacterium]|jgi:signal transduction histidine kinase
MSARNGVWKILVVDDEAVIREGCERILTREKSETIEVFTEADGQAGLEKIASEPIGTFQIALVDLKMPRFGGMEFIEAVQKLSPRTICIMITGYATIETAVEAIKKGAYDYIPKPFTPSQLRIVVQRAQERYQLIEEREEFRAKAEAAQEAAEKAKEQFIHLVYHELKSPLGVVRSYLENLLRLPTDPEKARNSMERCLTRTDALLQLVNDLLSLSKIGKEEKKLELELVDLVQVAEQTAQFQFVEAEKKKVSLSLEHEGPVMLSANLRMMEELLGNLVSNAIKYNRPGGHVRLFLKEGQSGVTLVCEDTGIGMKKEEQAQLFTQFYRVKNEDTRMIAGTGLGLSIAKTIVEAHRGSIALESEAGVGTKISVFLPKGGSNEG